MGMAKVLPESPRTLALRRSILRLPNPRSEINFYVRRQSSLTVAPSSFSDRGTARIEMVGYGKSGRAGRDPSRDVVGCSDG